MIAHMRRLALVVTLFAVCLGLSGARAGGVDLPHIDVEKIKASCRNGVSPLLDYGVTSDRMQGNMEYRECLKIAVLGYWKQMSPNEKADAQFTKQLDDFTNPFIKIVNDIFLGNKSCPCGTLYNDYYSLFTAEVYELLLTGMAEASQSN